MPHIFGETRYATMFAQGYATAEDRLFLMDVLRHVGRARMSEFLGAVAGQHRRWTASSSPSRRTSRRT